MQRSAVLRTALIFEGNAHTSVETSLFEEFNRTGHGVARHGTARHQNAGY